MKKLLIVVLALCTGASIVNAQDAASQKIRFGIKAGGNLTTLGKLNFLGEDYDYKYKPGLTAGVFAEIPLGNQFSFIPEINYSEKGGKINETVEDVKVEFDQRASYIDVPVTFAYSVSPGFKIFAGPQVSFFLSQTSKIYFNDEQQGEDNTDDSEIAKTLAGGLIGLGYDITNNLNINARYMRDFQKASSSDSDATDKAINSGFSLSLGYKF